MQDYLEALSQNARIESCTNATENRHSISHDQIAQLAYRFWTERGCVHGHDQEDWYRAEQQLFGTAS